MSAQTVFNIYPDTGLADVQEAVETYNKNDGNVVLILHFAEYSWKNPEENPRKSLLAIGTKEKGLKLIFNSTYQGKKDGKEPDPRATWNPGAVEKFAESQNVIYICDDQDPSKLLVKASGAEYMHKAGEQDIRAYSELLRESKAASQEAAAKPAQTADGPKAEARSTAAPVPTLPNPGTLPDRPTARGTGGSSAPTPTSSSFDMGPKPPVQFPPTTSALASTAAAPSDGKTGQVSTAGVAQTPAPPDNSVLDRSRLNAGGTDMAGAPGTPASSVPPAQYQQQFAFQQRPTAPGSGLAMTPIPPYVQQPFQPSSSATAAAPAAGQNHHTGPHAATSSAAAPGNSASAAAAPRTSATPGNPANTAASAAAAAEQAAKAAETARKIADARIEVARADAESKAAATDLARLNIELAALEQEKQQLEAGARNIAARDAFDAESARLTQKTEADGAAVKSAAEAQRGAMAARTKVLTEREALGNEKRMEQNRIDQAQASFEAADSQFKALQKTTPAGQRAGAVDPPQEVIDELNETKATAQATLDNALFHLRNEEKLLTERKLHQQQQTGDINARIQQLTAEMELLSSGSRRPARGEQSSSGGSGGASDGRHQISGDSLYLAEPENKRLAMHWTRTRKIVTDEQMGRLPNYNTNAHFRYIVAWICANDNGLVPLAKPGYSSLAGSVSDHAACMISGDSTVPLPVLYRFSNYTSLGTSKQKGFVDTAVDKLYALIAKSEEKTRTATESLLSSEVSSDPGAAREWEPTVDTLKWAAKCLNSLFPNTVESIFSVNGPVRSGDVAAKFRTTPVILCASGASGASGGNAFACTTLAIFLGALLVSTRYILKYMLKAERDALLWLLSRTVRLQDEDDSTVPPPPAGFSSGRKQDDSADMQQPHFETRIDPGVSRQQTAIQAEIDHLRGVLPQLESDIGQAERVMLDFREDYLKAERALNHATRQLDEANARRRAAGMTANTYAAELQKLDERRSLLEADLTFAKKKMEAIQAAIQQNDGALKEADAAAKSAGDSVAQAVKQATESRKERDDYKAAQHATFLNRARGLDTAISSIAQDILRAEARRETAVSGLERLREELTRLTQSDKAPDAGKQPGPTGLGRHFAYEVTGTPTLQKKADKEGWSFTVKNAGNYIWKAFTKLALHNSKPPSASLGVFTLPTDIAQGDKVTFTVPLSRINGRVSCFMQPASGGQVIAQGGTPDITFGELPASEKETPEGSPDSQKENAGNAAEQTGQGGKSAPRPKPQITNNGKEDDASHGGDDADQSLRTPQTSRRSDLPMSPAVKSLRKTTDLLTGFYNEAKKMQDSDKGTEQFFQLFNGLRNEEMNLLVPKDNDTNSQDLGTTSREARATRLNQIFFVCVSAMYDQIDQDETVTTESAIFTEYDPPLDDADRDAAVRAAKLLRSWQARAKPKSPVRAPDDAEKYSTWPPTIEMMNIIRLESLSDPEIRIAAARRLWNMQFTEAFAAECKNVMAKRNVSFKDANKQVYGSALIGATLLLGDTTNIQKVAGAVNGMLDAFDEMDDPCRRTMAEGIRECLRWTNKSQVELRFEGDESSTFDDKQQKTAQAKICDIIDAYVEGLSADTRPFTEKAEDADACRLQYAVYSAPVEYAVNQALAKANSNVRIVVVPKDVPRRRNRGLQKETEAVNMMHPTILGVSLKILAQKQGFFGKLKRALSPNPKDKAPEGSSAAAEKTPKKRELKARSGDAADDDELKKLLPLHTPVMPRKESGKPGKTPKKG